MASETNGSDDVIRMVVQLDEAELEQQVLAAQTKLNHKLQEKSPATRRPADSPLVAATVAAKPKPAEEKRRAREQGNEIGKAIGFHLSRTLGNLLARVLPSPIASVISGKLSESLSSSVSRLTGRAKAAAQAGAKHGWGKGMGSIAGGMAKLGGGAGEAAGAAATAGGASEAAGAASASAGGVASLGSAAAAAALPIAAAAAAAAAVVVAAAALSEKLNSLAAEFSQYNQRLYGQTKQLELMDKLYKINAAKSMEPMLSAWNEMKLAWLEAKDSVMKSLAPAFKSLGSTIKAMIPLVQAFAYSFAKTILVIERGMGIIDQKTFDQLGREVDRDFASARKGQSTLAARAEIWNRGFIDSLYAPGQAPSGPNSTPQPAGGNAPPPVGSNGNAGGVAFGSPSKMPPAQPSLPRMPTPMPPQFNVNQHFQQQIQHEEAVQRAVEQVRDRLMDSLEATANEVRLYASIVDGRNSTRHLL